MKTRKLAYVLILLLFLAGGVVSAAWTFRTEVAEVKLSIEKPVRFEKLKLDGNVSIVNRTFEISGATSLYAAEDCELAMMMLAGLSKEEKKQLEALSLEVEVEEHTNTVDLLRENLWLVERDYNKGDSTQINLTLKGELAEDVEKDSIGFDVLTVWRGQQGA